MQAIDSATITLKVKFTDGSNTLVTRKVVDDMNASSTERDKRLLSAAQGQRLTGERLEVLRDIEQELYDHGHVRVHKALCAAFPELGG